MKDALIFTTTFFYVVMTWSSKFLSISIFIYFLKHIQQGEIDSTSSHFQNTKVQIKVPQCNFLSIEEYFHSTTSSPSSGRNLERFLQEFGALLYNRHMTLEWLLKIFCVPTLIWGKIRRQQSVFSLILPWSLWQ